MSGRKNLESVIWLSARVCALLLLLIAGEANAGAIYKCMDAGGGVAFQATACDAGATQTTVQVRGQPLIDADAPAWPAARSAGASKSRKLSGGSRRRGRVHRASLRKQAAQATSWECRAADGEVFYRHSRCPHSVPGDGVMRSGGAYAIRHGKGKRGGRDAWSPLSVHARKVPRSEACRRINAVAAVERDGSARDERASVYEHDLGRDPCAGY